MVIGGCVEYNAKDGKDEKSVCRVLFTGLGINSGVGDCKLGIYARISDGFPE